MIPRLKSHSLLISPSTNQEIHPDATKVVALGVTGRENSLLG
jgi:hypothetical protein